MPCVPIVTNTWTRNVVLVRRVSYMEVLAAGLVLAWIVLILLAFAVAGVVRQLRDLQSAQSATISGAINVLEPDGGLPSSVRPGDVATHSVVFLASASCPLCIEVAPAFAALAVEHVTDTLKFVVLSVDDQVDMFDGPEYVVDAGAYHLLDPGWSPAIIAVNRSGRAVAIKPADSFEAPRAAVEHVSALAPHGV
jgi:hypothetical protein